MAFLRSACLLPFLLAPPLLWGCLGSNPDVLKPEPRDVAADEIAAAVCGGAASCCRALTYDQPSDVCVAAVRNEVMMAIIAAETDRREVIEDRVDDCVEAYAAGIDSAPSCTQLPGPSDLDLLCPDLFTPIPKGTRAPGDACAGTYDCAPPQEAGSRSCFKRGDDSGVCIWRLERAAGQPCATDVGIAESCAAGLTCVPSGAGPVCGAVPGYDGPCIPGANACQEGLRCVSAADGFRCRQAPMEDLRCTLGPTDCPMGLICDQGECRAPNGTCTGSGCPKLVLDSVCR